MKFFEVLWHFLISAFLYACNAVSESQEIFFIFFLLLLLYLYQGMSCHRMLIFIKNNSTFCGLFQLVFKVIDSFLQFDIFLEQNLLLLFHCHYLIEHAILSMVILMSFLDRFFTQRTSHLSLWARFKMIFYCISHQFFLTPFTRKLSLLTYLTMLVQLIFFEKVFAPLTQEKFKDTLLFMFFKKLSLHLLFTTFVFASNNPLRTLFILMLLKDVLQKDLLAELALLSFKLAQLHMFLHLIPSNCHRATLPLTFDRLLRTGLLMSTSSRHRYSLKTIFTLDHEKIKNGLISAGSFDHLEMS